MQGTTYQERVTVLQAESERVAQYLTRLPREAWHQPSACGEWQVRDVVAHLVGVAEFYADNVSRGLQGDAASPPGRPPAGSMTGAASAAGVAQRALAARQQLGDTILDAFKTTADRLNSRLASLHGQEQTIPCYHPGGIVQAQQFIDLRLKELAVHEWDIRSRFEPDAQLSPASLPAILRLIDGSIASGSLRWAFQAGEKLAAPLRYRFEVTGAGPYQTDMVVTGDTARQEPASSVTPDVTLRSDASTFTLLVYGRLRLDTAVQEGRLTVTGDAEQAAAFMRWFRGI